MEHKTWNMIQKKKVENFSTAPCPMPHVPCRRGFSLVEAVIYTGLTILVLVAVVNMLLLLSRAYGQLKSSRHMQTSAVSALDRVVRDIRNSQSVDMGQSTLGVSPGVLTLNSTDTAGTAQTFQFYVLNGVLRVKKDSVDLGPLTLPDVTVSNLIFRRISTGISQAVKIDMTFTTGTGQSARSANFYGTAILRDSY